MNVIQRWKAAWAALETHVETATEELLLDEGVEAVRWRNEGLRLGQAIHDAEEAMIARCGMPTDGTDDDEPDDDEIILSIFDL